MMKTPAPRIIWPAMPAPQRGAVGAVVGALLAAGVARADLGADRAASVLASPAFLPALFAGGAVAVLLAPVFARGTPAFLLAQAGAVMAALGVGVLALWLGLWLGAQADLGRLAQGALGEPMAWGAVLAAWPAGRATAWRLARGRQSRK